MLHVLLLILLSVFTLILVFAFIPTFFAMFRVLGIMFGLVVWIGVLMRELNISLWWTLCYCQFGELKVIKPRKLHTYYLVEAPMVSCLGA